MHFKVQLTYIECVRGIYIYIYIYIYILRFKASTAARRYVTVSERITFALSGVSEGRGRGGSRRTRAARGGGCALWVVV